MSGPLTKNTIRRAARRSFSVIVMRQALIDGTRWAATSRSRAASAAEPANRPAVWPSAPSPSQTRSKDGTPDVVRGTRAECRTLLLRHPLYPVHRISTPYHGIPGKGSAVRTIMERARELGARACAIVDSDLRSITPEWIELLLEPIVTHGYEFVAPLYARHRYDGTITNTIVYPLTRALYGRRLRQPIGGDFGFSGELAARFLAFEDWEGPVAQYGIDIFMTTTALAEVNKQIEIEIQEEGIAVPSTVRIRERVFLHVAVTNHRSRKEDFDLLVSEVVRIGDGLV